MSYAGIVPMVATIKNVLPGKIQQYSGHVGHEIVNVIFLLENGVEVPFTFRTYLSDHQEAFRLLKNFAGVGSSENPTGKKVKVLYNPYARREEQICGIGHLTNDQWFSPVHIFQKKTYPLSDFLKEYNL